MTRNALWEALRGRVARIFLFFVAGFLLVMAIEVGGPYLIDPATLLLGDSSAANDYEALKARLGLDRPWYTRALHSLASLANLKHEKSFRYSLPVTKLLAQRWSATLGISLWALGVAVTVGSIIGAGSVYFGSLRSLIFPVWRLLIAVPVIIAASLAASTQVANTFGGIGDTALAGALLGLYSGLWYATVIQNALKGELSSWYLRGMQACGASRLTILRKASTGVIHRALGAVDLQLAFILTGGTVVVEYSFHVEGLGLLFLDSLLYMDLPVVRVLLAGSIVGYAMVASFLIGLRSALDPRILESEL